MCGLELFASRVGLFHGFSFLRIISFGFLLPLAMDFMQFILIVDQGVSGLFSFKICLLIIDRGLGIRHVALAFGSHQISHSAIGTAKPTPVSGTV